MPIRGSKPKDPSQVRRTNRNDVSQWTEVVNEPYTGPCPELPATRTIMQAGQRVEVPVLDATAGWWEAISAMPHCTLWSPSDWRFALTTALVADMAYRGNNAAATELRNREKVIGTTVAFRRDLRIRYVEPRDGDVLRLADRQTDVKDYVRL